MGAGMLFLQFQHLLSSFCTLTIVFSTSHCPVQILLNSIMVASSWKNLLICWWSAWGPGHSLVTIQINARAAFPSVFNLMYLTIEDSLRHEVFYMVLDDCKV